MTIGQWFQKWGLKVSLKIGVVNVDFLPNSADRDAAWDLYVELITRITTQPLSDEHGLEKSALDSVHQLFGLTRAILKARGRTCSGFAKIAVVVLNQIVRPFTAKWHKLSQAGGFDNAVQSRAFRRELAKLQVALRNYTRLLADLAEVEDLTDLVAESQ